MTVYSGLHILSPKATNIIPYLLYLVSLCKGIYLGAISIISIHSVGSTIALNIWINYCIKDLANFSVEMMTDRITHIPVFFLT